MEVKASEARAFRSQAAFRVWLKANHGRTPELLVRCYKTSHGTRGLTYRGALDEALCFGWIDGVRHGLDEVSFAVRFTPRKTESVWSRVNIKRAKELQAEGRMQPPGLAAFAKSKRAPYSYESRSAELDSSFLRRLRADERAWQFFARQAPWYRRTSSFWVMSAKREETREKRFAVLLKCSAAGEPVPPLRRPGTRQSK